MTSMAVEFNEALIELIFGIVMLSVIPLSKTNKNLICFANFEKENSCYNAIRGPSTKPLLSYFFTHFFRFSKFSKIYPEQARISIRRAGTSVGI